MNAPRTLSANATGLINALALALILGGVSPPAQAHKSSDAYLTLQVQGAQITQRLDIALRDLDRDLALDADDNGELSWGEVKARWADIDALASAALQVRSAGQPCTAVQAQTPQLDSHTDGRYVVLQHTLQCAGPVSDAQVDYRLFEHSDASHRAVLRVVRMAPTQAGLDAGESSTALLTPGAGPQAVALPGSAAGAASHAAPHGFFGFVAEGARHIAIGADHILFLVTLLMVAVWRRDGAGWAPRERARSAWLETSKLVTAFTVSHSLTLALAASGVLAPPSRWIESLIAASVLLAAIDNLRPLVSAPRWMIVALFGLVHGFGFAGPLQDLGLQRGNLAVPLLGFNLGVELGQLALVAVLLPLACWLRASTFYRHVVVRGGSVAVAMVATLWLAERSLNLSLMP
ncbi:MAG: hypothetical protein RJA98_491 [Pseudomonadota bacterium]|jgi:hypothetical protein